MDKTAMVVKVVMKVVVMDGVVEMVVGLGEDAEV